MSDKPIAEVVETAREDIYGYEVIRDKFFGKSIRVYIHNGAVLSGTYADGAGRFILLVDAVANKSAIVNLDHVASIIRI